MSRRLGVVLLVGVLAVSSCGGDDAGSGDAAAGSTTSSTAPTTTSTTVQELDGTSPGVEPMCAAVRATAGPGEGSSSVERAIRAQLTRWEAVAEVAPPSLVDHAEALVGFYERSIAAREEFGFDIRAQAEAGRISDNEQTVEEQVADIQLTAAVETLCDQDPPGTFVPVEVDVDALAFCAHFDLAPPPGGDAEVGTPEYNENFWTARAELWSGAVELAPEELRDATETFAERYERILPLYEAADFATDADGVLQARIATPEEEAALQAVSDHLLAECEVIETGDSGARYQPN